RPPRSSHRPVVAVAAYLSKRTTNWRESAGSLGSSLPDPLAPPSEVRSMQRPPWLVFILLVVALVSTAGWAIPARRSAPERQASAAGGVLPANAQAGQVAGHSHG